MGFKLSRMNNITNKNEHKRFERLKKFFDIDLCSCGNGDKLKCHGICRQNHTNQKTGIVKCEELYQINNYDIQKINKRKSNKKYKSDSNQDQSHDRKIKQKHRQKRDHDRFE